MEATVVLTFSWWYLHSGSYHIDEYRSTKLCNMCSHVLAIPDCRAGGTLPRALEVGSVEDAPEGDTPSIGNM